MQIEKLDKHWIDYIANRTFGMELEFADADKERILLPQGYKWTNNKLTMMNNSDGSAVTHHGQFGGEINTRPYHYCIEDLNELEEFIASIKDAGGYLMWNEGFDAHLYVKDMDINVLKRMFLLSYYTAYPTKRIFDIAEWWETKYLVPSPPYDVVERVMQADTLENMLKVFSNGSDRGHIRYWLNLCSIQKIGTCEFRIFNSSWDFNKVLETIKFMYSFVEYAYLHEDTEEYKNLTTVEKCLEVFNINYDNVPQRHKPLIWAAEHSDNVTVVGQMFKKTNRMMSFIKKEAAKFDVAHVVNSYYMDIEQILTNRKIMLYTKEYFVYIIYKILKGEIKHLKFDENYSFLDVESENPSELIAAVYLFNSIKKHKNSDDVYHKSLYDDFIQRLDYYKKKYTERYKKLVENLKSKDIEVVYPADIADAMINCKDDDIMIYQNEFHSGIKATSNALLRCLQDDFGFKERIKTKYSEIDEEKVNYIAISQHAFMGRREVFRDQRTYAYSNVVGIGDSSFNKRSITPLKYKRLPDDYVLTENSKFRFMRASMSEIDYLRMIYLKKGIILGSAPFCYLWFLDDYVFGACMFDFLKVLKYGMDAVWMKSDFVIEHPIPKLSKLLIMGTLSTEFKEELDVRYKREIGVIATSVFTDKPVSSKYRGVFKLHERCIGKLHYVQDSGIRGRLDDILKSFYKKYGNEPRKE